jgi:hypothetical protein
MPRSKTANDDRPATIPNKQERADLLSHHMVLLRAQEVRLASKKAELDELRAEYSEEQQTLTDLFLQAKSDTRIERQMLERALKVEKSGVRAAHKEAADWNFVCEALGYPYQPDMFGTDATPEPAKDLLFWEAEGYLNGRRAGDPAAPKGCTGEALQAFLKGRDKGQAENGLALGRAKNVIEARATPSVEPPVDLNSEEGQEAIDDAAKKLKKSDFMKTGGDDAGAQASAA